jgi:hypothetical protein
MTRQEQIAVFLDRHITLPRAVSPYGEAYMYADIAWPRPSVEQVADELLAIGEFRALQLGTWLGTTDGQVIAQAVEMVSPPFYRQDVELLVAALQHSAKIQNQEGKDAAGKFALKAIGAAALAAFFIRASGEGPATA